MKKGQLTLLAIVGILVIIIVLIGLYLFVVRGDVSLSKEFSLSDEAKDYDEQVSECLEQSIINYFQSIGVNGGTLIPSESYNFQEESGVYVYFPYLNYENQKLILSLDEINEESSPHTIQNWDSLRHATFILALEEEFGIKLENNEIVSMVKYDIIKNTIESYV